MSQQPPKKSGSRDINELKARLGLKKGVPPTTAKPNGSPSGGVVPPPGLAVPPPPGAGPPLLFFHSSMQATLKPSWAARMAAM